MAHGKKSHGVSTVQVKSTMDSIQAIETSSNFVQNKMDVDEWTEPIISLSSGIGPHRQTHDRKISERHHPYTRTTSIPETSTIPQGDLISENIASCESLMMSSCTKLTYLIK